MMQVVENRAWLTCRLEAVRVVNNEVELEVWLEDTRPVDPYPDLLRQRVGARVRLLMPAGPVPHVGRRFTVKARLAGPGIVRADRASLTLLGN